MQKWLTNSLLSYEAPTCYGGNEEVHALGIVIVDVMLLVCNESNWGGLQTGHIVKQPLEGIAPHFVEMYGCIKRFFGYYGPWYAGKTVQLLNHFLL